MMYYKGTNFKRTDRFKLADPSVRNITNMGFTYKRSMSDAEDEVYEYSFPVYSYHEAITLEARFLLWRNSNQLVVDVFDIPTHGIYGPWYLDESGIHKRIINIINNNIYKTMKRMNITKIKGAQHE